MCLNVFQVSVSTSTVSVCLYICRHAPAGMHVYVFVFISHSFPEGSRFLVSAGYELIFDNDGVQMEDKTRLKNSTLSAKSFYQTFITDCQTAASNFQLLICFFCLLNPVTVGLSC